MGVRLMNLAAGDSVVGLALNAESLADNDQEPADSEEDQAGPQETADRADPEDAGEDLAGDLGDEPGEDAE
jgi:hypothetical protein